MSIVTIGDRAPILFSRNLHLVSRHLISYPRNAPISLGCALPGCQFPVSGDCVRNTFCFGEQVLIRKVIGDGFTVRPGKVV